MYGILLSLHSFFRWIVLVVLLTALIRAVRGLYRKSDFSSLDNFIRHSTATAAHIQLMLGYTLYFNSPFIRYFREHFEEASKQFDYIFFGILHIVLMTIAVLLITAGSSLAKRKKEAVLKFRTMALWFGAALLLIIIAIPWPFSPLAKRPYFKWLSYATFNNQSRQAAACRYPGRDISFSIAGYCGTAQVPVS